MSQEIGKTTKYIISKSKKKKNGQFRTQEVVIKTYLGKFNGKPKYSSKTVHQAI
jgi:hypothetical protein